MLPDKLDTEALALAWAVDVGAVVWAEVVVWADGWILALDRPPEALLELSLSAGRGRPDTAWTLLRQLARSGNPEGGVSLLAQKLLDVLQAGQVNSAYLANRLSGLRFLACSAVPDDVRLPALSEEFLNAALDLEILKEPWHPEFTLDPTAEVVLMLERFL